MSLFLAFARPRPPRHRVLLWLGVVAATFAGVAAVTQTPKPTRAAAPTLSAVGLQTELRDNPLTPPGVHSVSSLAVASGKTVGIDGQVVATRDPDPGRSGRFLFRVARGGTTVAQIPRGVAPTAQGASVKGIVGTPFRHQIVASGSPLPTFVVTSGRLPPGISVDSATGLISGTPTEASGDAVSIRVSNGIGKHVDVFIAFRIGITPSISVKSYVHGVVGEPYNDNFTAAGFPEVGFTLTGGSLPPGLTIGLTDLDPVWNSTTKAIIGTPTQAGTFLFDLRASLHDDSTSFSTRPIQIVIDPPPATTTTVAPTTTTTVPPPLVPVPCPDLAGTAATSSIENYGWGLEGIDDGVYDPNRLGWHSDIFDTTTPTQAVCVQVDLGSVRDVSGVRLWPAHPTGYRPSDSFGFPLAYEVQLATQPDFSDATTVAKKTESSGEQMQLQDTPRKVGFALTQSARYVRIAATQLGPITASTYAFALAEITIIAPSQPGLMCSYPPPTATVGQPFRYAVTVFGEPEPVVSLRSGWQLPPGLTMDTSGVISGTPTTKGWYDFFLIAVGEWSIFMGQCVIRVVASS